MGGFAFRFFVDADGVGGKSTLMMETAGVAAGAAVVAAGRGPGRAGLLPTAVGTTSLRGGTAARAWRDSFTKKSTASPSANPMKTEMVPHKVLTCWRRRAV